MIKMTSNSRKTLKNSLEDMSEYKQGYLTGQNRLERRIIAKKKRLGIKLIINRQPLTLQ